MDAVSGFGFGLRHGGFVCVVGASRVKQFWRICLDWRFEGEWRIGHRIHGDECGGADGAVFGAMLFVDKECWAHGI